MNLKRCALVGAALWVLLGCGSSQAEKIDFVVDYVREDWEPLVNNGECTSLADPEDPTSPSLLPKVGDSFGIEIGTFQSTVPGVMTVGKVVPHFDGAPGNSEVCLFTFTFVGVSTKDRFLTLYVPDQILPVIVDAPLVDLEAVRNSDFQILLTRNVD